MRPNRCAVLKRRHTATPLSAQDPTPPKSPQPFENAGPKSFFAQICPNPVVSIRDISPYLLRDLLPETPLQHGPLAVQLLLDIRHRQSVTLLQIRRLLGMVRRHRLSCLGGGWFAAIDSRVWGADGSPTSTLVSGGKTRVRRTPLPPCSSNSPFSVFVELPFLRVRRTPLPPCSSNSPSSVGIRRTPPFRSSYVDQSPHKTTHSINSYCHQLHLDRLRVGSHVRLALPDPGIVRLAERYSRLQVVVLADVVLQFGGQILFYCGVIALAEVQRQVLQLAELVGLRDREDGLVRGHDVEHREDGRAATHHGSGRPRRGQRQRI